MDDSRMDAAIRLASGGIVLLENRGGALPLALEREVVLLGVPAYMCFPMGWGSGDMPFSRPVEYADALKERGVRLNSAFEALYRNHVRQYRKAHPRINCDWWNWTRRFPEPVVSASRFLSLASSAPENAVAVVAIGRAAGEAEDMSDAKGSFRLHKEEERLLDLAVRNFSTVVAVLNVCGVIDTSFMDRYPVKALVHASVLGIASGYALADILTGARNPSGKTVDTWARSYRDYSTRAHFGSFEIPYREGLFVGYRHFDHFPEKVRYPFGHGLSYTEFSIRPAGGSLEGGQVCKVRVVVENIGTRPGRETVEFYLKREGADARTRPQKSLCAFAKTRELSPGEKETLETDFRLCDFMEWDAEENRWMFPPGRRTVFAGASSASVEAVFSFDPPGGVFRPPSKKHPSPLDGTWNGRKIGDVVKEMSPGELACAVNGVPLGGASGAGGASSGIVPGEAGEFWSSGKYSLPPVVCADGPSGVRLDSFGEVPRQGVAREMFQWPCETAIAQNWDAAAAEEYGRCLAADMERAGVDVILAPGLNIHRNPLCGRSFEYLSEDPYLAGKLGAAIVRGIQTRSDGKPSGRFATIKHFCCNNQESHRREADSRVDETTLREIYLRPFEITVCEAEPLFAMSSYNLVNGKWAGADRRLIDGILRGEWGFSGLVFTDWWCFSDKRFHPACGNDIAMPGMQNEIDDMLESLEKGIVRREDLETSAARLFAAAAAIRLSRGGDCHS